MTGPHTFRAWSCTVRLVVDDARVARAGDRRPRRPARPRRPRRQPVPRRLRALDRQRPRRPSVAGARACSSTCVDAALRAAERTDGAVVPTVGHSDDRARLRPRHRRRRRTPSHRPHVGPRPTGAGCALDREVGPAHRPAPAARSTSARPPRRTRPTSPRRTLHRRLRHGRPGRARRRSRRRRPPPGRLVHQGRRDARPPTANWCSSAAAASPPRRPPSARWTRGGRPVHHIVDPRTGRPADGPWRTASVAAPSAFEANIASTAAIVLGDGRRRLARGAHGSPPASSHRDGPVRTTTGWPALARWPVRAMTLWYVARGAGLAALVLLTSRPRSARS